MSGTGEQQNNQNIKGRLAVLGGMLLIGLIASRVVDMALNGYTEEKRQSAIGMAEDFLKGLDRWL